MLLIVFFHFNLTLKIIFVSKTNEKKCEERRSRRSRCVQANAGSAALVAHAVGRVQERFFQLVFVVVDHHQLGARLLVVVVWQGTIVIQIHALSDEWPHPLTLTHTHAHIHTCDILKKKSRRSLAQFFTTTSALHLYCITFDYIILLLLHLILVAHYLKTKRVITFNKYTMLSIVLYILHITIRRERNTFSTCLFVYFSLYYSLKRRKRSNYLTLI